MWGGLWLPTMGSVGVRGDDEKTADEVGYQLRKIVGSESSS